jgi:Ras-related protein Rab-2A
MSDDQVSPFDKVKAVKYNYEIKKSKSLHKSLEKNEEIKTYYRFKFILLGDISVGKSCIAMKFVNNEFVDKYDCTVGVEFKLKTLKLSTNISADLQLWDTCGQEKFRSITKQYFRNANGIIIVFDLTSKSSFLEVDNWIEDINKNGVNKEEVGILLLGNKYDLISERQISYSQATEYAKKHNFEYIEVSAKEGININEAFEKLSWMSIHKESNNNNHNFSVANTSNSILYLNNSQKEEQAESCC